MAAAWQGKTIDLVPETESQSTVGNAQAVARYAAEVGADEVVVITSSWHRPRAALLHLPGPATPSQRRPGKKRGARTGPGRGGPDHPVRPHLRGLARGPPGGSPPPPRPALRPG